MPACLVNCVLHIRYAFPKVIVAKISLANKTNDFRGSREKDLMSRSEQFAIDLNLKRANLMRANKKSLKETSLEHKYVSIKYALK